MLYLNHTGLEIGLRPPGNPLVARGKASNQVVAREIAEWFVGLCNQSH